MKDAVRARLGFDPFVPPAEVVARASVLRVGDELRATLALSGDGAEAGERRISSGRSDCSEVASAMALALSIAIDPLSITRESSSGQSIIVVPMVSPRLPEPPPPPVMAPKLIEASLGAAGSLGATLAPTAGLTAGAALVAEHWSLRLEGRADLPRSRSFAGGRVEAGVVSGTAVPCARLAGFAGCALATVAALRGSGRDFVDSRELTSTYVALGARVQFDLPPSGPLAFRIHLDLLAPLSRVALRVGDQSVWTSPPVQAALGLASVVRFR